MIKTLFQGSSSACFEIQNHSPYYSPEEYTVRLDGREVYHGHENVFSVFELKPDTEYELNVRFSETEETLSFRTESENCCINVRSFGAVGDGVHEDTAAIQTAINMIPEKGRLYFPEGTYLTLTLTLRSHITIELSENAVLLG